MGVLGSHCLSSNLFFSAFLRYGEVFCQKLRFAAERTSVTLTIVGGIINNKKLFWLFATHFFTNSNSEKVFSSI